MGSHTIPYTLAPHEGTHVAGGSDDIDSALAIAAMANLTTGKIWQGVAGRPSEVDLPAGGVVISSGTYIGNDTDNRAIAHGLGVIPKLVIVLCTNATWDERSGILAHSDYFVSFKGRYNAVTARTTTNFYVPEENDCTLNLSSKTYVWVAIG
uniref:Uncharacterized protein n=1 Tax=viral metagenome TaxID=1070528 RepID=A0A6M3LYZ5_9ZZZZ